MITRVFFRQGGRRFVGRIAQVLRASGEQIAPPMTVGLVAGSRLARVERTNRVAMNAG